MVCCMLFCAATQWCRDLGATPTINPPLLWCGGLGPSCCAFAVHHLRIYICSRKSIKLIVSAVRSFRHHEDYICHIYIRIEYNMNIYIYLLYINVDIESTKTSSKQIKVNLNNRTRKRVLIEFRASESIYIYIYIFATRVAK